MIMKMKKLVKNLWTNQRDLVLYMFFGIFTTVVNWGTYFIFTRLLSVSIYWSNILAWFFAVLFAYLTNRRWVFHSNTSGTVLVAREIFAFFSSRAFSGGVDMLLLFLICLLYTSDAADEL